LRRKNPAAVDGKDAGADAAISAHVIKLRGGQRSIDKSVPEIVDPGVTGYIVDDVAQAAEAVETVRRLPRSRVRAAFDERFTARAMAQHYAQLYWQLARDSRASLLEGEAA
jgi:hypothetical protein